MRVLQLIDSLHAGGAERVAVNLANGLSNKIDKSFLCTTRQEGILKESIVSKVGYLFLNKTKTIDIRAIYKLRNFIVEKKIEILHAHSSSFFLAIIIKIVLPKLVVIWHDHYGESEFLDKRPKFVLKCCSKLFSHIFVVNSKLERWSKEMLYCKSVNYLSNFPVNNNKGVLTNLNGEKSKRIICLANLRPQKDHINLLKAFKVVWNTNKNWTLHIVGHDFKDEYSLNIKNFIKDNSLENNVYVYGSCSDISNILNQSDIGVLASKSEGLPLSLLEYGLAGLATIATNVGDCNKVISNDVEGILIPSNNTDALVNALFKYINNTDLRLESGQCLQAKVNASFSQLTILNSMIEIYKKHQL
ncbi:glycosyltransferase [Thalassobellus sediminis]|uniref:glycosyltransferase n=1 Tax=Thalassobellus sediminis TaxID=3367753 RepID=UPI003792BB74